MAIMYDTHTILDNSATSTAAKFNEV